MALPCGALSAYAVVGMGASRSHAHLAVRSSKFALHSMITSRLNLLMLGVRQPHYTVAYVDKVAPMYAESLLPRETDEQR